MDVRLAPFEWAILGRLAVEPGLTADQIHLNLLWNQPLVVNDALAMMQQRGFIYCLNDQYYVKGYQHHRDLMEQEVQYWRDLAERMSAALAAADHRAAELEQTLRALSVLSS